MSNNSEIGHHFLHLNEIYADERFNRLIVPDYQRGFDWNQSHVDDLWEDIRYHLNLKLDDKQEDFFVGTIILKTPDGDHADSSDKSFEIVDGQQRLTSFYLLFIALRQKFIELRDIDLIRDVDKDFIRRYEDSEDKRGIPRLLGVKKIREVLEFISEKEWDGNFPEKEDKLAMDGRKRVAVNRQLKKSLKSHSDQLEINLDETRPFNLKELSKLYKVVNSIKMIVLTVKTPESAFYLFETTNARGKALEPGDLLKNHLFGQVKSVKKEEVYDRWEKVVDDSSGKLVLMIKHFYHVHNGIVDKSNLYREIKKLGDADMILESIEHYSKFHKLMNNGTQEDLTKYLTDDLQIYDTSQATKKFDDLHLSVLALKFFKSDISYPVIYAFLVGASKLLRDSKDLKKKGHKDSFRKTVSQVFTALENFHFINYRICKNPSNKIDKPYAGFANDLHESANTLSVNKFLIKLEELFEFLRSNINTKGEFREAFTSISYENKDTDRPVLSYIFHKIETNRIGLQPARFIFPPRDGQLCFDIEHIASRKHVINGNICNQKDFAEFQYDDELIDKEDLKDNIGNLSMMQRELNNDLSNRIPRKKQEFMRNERNTGKYTFHSFLDDYSKIGAKCKECKTIYHKEIGWPKQNILPGTAWEDVPEDTLCPIRLTNGFCNASKDSFDSEWGTYWDKDCIEERAKELSDECYEKVFQIGKGKFPIMSSQYLDKFKS